ncbi:MAG: isoleucine--tRNA ligase [bacterium]
MENELYPPLARKYHDAESERLVSAFWKEQATFRKSIEIREGGPDFVFYEGPPTANGLPGVHHVISRLCKDIMCRFKTMTGFRVLRKAGWDTHGLPVERAVEKELGIMGRQAIEKFGVSAFNAKCRESVWKCKAEWDEFTDRIGYWVDLDDPYITYKDNYIETVWWILSQFDQADLLYRGHKVVPYCPICGTPISSHEMANSYQTVADPSIYVKIKVADADEFFVTWTTTPWTLPSNVALAVGEDFSYVRVRHGDEVLILAEARLGVLDPEVKTEVLETFKGRDLLGRSYEQLFPFLSPGDQRAFVVVPADFVTLDSGSGIVHMAPAFGEDDFLIGQRDGLAFFNPLDPHGQFTAEIEPYAGLHVKKADPRIIKDLKAQGRLLRVETYRHEYPFHDRCGNALIYFATPSWFIKTSAMREDLLAANRDIRWAPPEVGSRRFGNWLEGNIDWSLSRNRFWGTPLNVWICDSCGAQHMPTCRHDLTELTGEDQSALDLHRPYVDEISFPCQAADCSGSMFRTPEVIDVWFDSGSMPFAQYHYPFENRELFENQFPADFISEGIDQTRGWFYTMLVISTFLFKRSSYKSCLVHELVLDNKGKKMSKSVGNVINPHEILRDEGADALRWYMISASPVWKSTLFDRKGVKESQRKLLATLENTYNFFALYANLDGFAPAAGGEEKPTLLDRWILSRLSSVTESVRSDLEELNFTRAAKTLGAFVINDVSNWYVRLNRRRFWKGELSTDKRTAYSVLYRVLTGSLRLLAPFIPFTTEELYRNLVQHEDPEASVHLADFPTSDPVPHDPDLERTMASAQEVVGLARSVRQDANLHTRQPLARLLVHSGDDRGGQLVADERITALMMEELNVKDVVWLEDPTTVMTFSAKPNYRQLGPRFGKRAPLAAKRVEAMTSDEITAFQAAGSVDLDLEGETTNFGGDEISVAETGVDPYIAAAGGGFSIAIDTTLTPALIEEGLCREIINRVQNLRKRSDLAVSDRIELAVRGGSQIASVLAHFGDRIASETLAVDLDPSLDLPFGDTFSIDDIEISIALGKQEPETGGSK